ncbi:MAG: ATP-grasp domain-containing protein [Treponemataceae bacterium]|nr:ATP-grasp domain-containing protein [Treponemataceae bacterium]
MKNVLILGAGLMQKPAIETASKLGYKVAVADGNPKAVCSSLADIFEPIDLKDRDSLLSFARNLDKNGGLEGVFTAGTDFSASVAFVAQHLSLPGHSYEAALNASDKIRMRTCFSEAGVPSPCFYCVDYRNEGKDLDEIRALPELSSFPLVVKPVDNMGGRGCRMVRSPEELASAVNIAVSFSRTKRAVVEQYMPGREFSIDSLVFDGEVTITGFADRHIFYPPYFIEMGHTMPTVINEKDWSDLAETFRDGIKALGLTHGAAKADIKLTPEGPMIGEIAARLSGGYMSGWTFPYASGINLTEQALLLALGKKPELLLEKRKATSVKGIWNLDTEKTSAERAWVSIPGVIEKTEGVSELLAEKKKNSTPLKDFLPRCNSGDKVSFPVNNVGKCGNIITCSENYDEAVSIAEEAVSSIVPVLRSDNKETEAFLSAPLDTEFPPSAFILPKECVESVFSECAGKNISSQEKIEMPAALIPYAEAVKDWNKRNIRKSLELFESLKTSFVDMPLCSFWKALFRGGVQGALYKAAEYEVEEK